MTEAVTFTLSSVPPLGALLGVQPATLLVGVEDDPAGGLRAFLGARWKGVYVLIDDPEAQEAFRRAWGSSGHVWLWPIPPREMLLQEVRDAVSGA